ncbi:hypothetical protein B0H10DRAFT_702932 [Mycena sp. CBHHK59/15]|nr:hypothetical protein B0H10DRAFT_702932 [Mycena sp. CBHHK59/15]
MPPTDCWLSDVVRTDAPGLIEHIFPDHCLPLPVDDILKAISGPGPPTSPGALFETDFRDPSGMGGWWTTFPDEGALREGDTANLLAGFFNGLGAAIRDVCRLAGKPVPKKKRRWTSAYSHKVSKPLKHPESCVYPHPPLVLFDGKEDEEGWHTVLSIAEPIYPEDESDDCSLHFLTQGGSDVFVCQDNRRFQIGFTIDPPHGQFRLVLLDHSGVVISHAFEIDHRPDLLVRSLSGLMLSSLSTIGFDPTISTLKGGRRQIKVGGDLYEIVKRLAITPDIRGKATVCWHARRNGLDFVIKDNWNDPSATLTEAMILDIAKDIPGITKLIALETIIIDGEMDSTARLRSVVPDAVETRLHQRMVLTPFAQKIQSFKSRKELVSVFIDAIEAHRRLVEKNILHCDISINNIMISEAQEVRYADASVVEHNPGRRRKIQPRLRKGILIDVDNSSFLDHLSIVVDIVGTFVFMSSAILLHGSSSEHKPSDDLESFFWVLVYICIRYAGPDDVTRADFADVRDRVQLFHEEGPQSDAAKMGRAKRRVLTGTEPLEREILPRFSPYFRELEDCVRDLQKAFIEGDCQFLTTRC